VSEQLAQRLAGEDGRVTFRTLVVACAMTAFLTALGATALSYAFVPTRQPATRMVAVRFAQPGVDVPLAQPSPAPAGPAAHATSGPPSPSPWAAARGEAVRAAAGALGQLEPTPPQVVAGGAVVADDLAAPCATLTLAGAVARGLAGCS
jgi:hypothetical protein